MFHIAKTRRCSARHAPRMARVIVALSVLLMLGLRTLPAVPAAQPSSGPTLEGLWHSEWTGGPAARGALTVRREGERYHASIGGFEAVAAADGTALRFA